MMRIPQFVALHESKEELDFEQNCYSIKIIESQKGCFECSIEI